MGRLDWWWGAYYNKTKNEEIIKLQHALARFIEIEIISKIEGADHFEYDKKVASTINQVIRLPGSINYKYRTEDGRKVPIRTVVLARTSSTVEYEKFIELIKNYIQEQKLPKHSSPRFGTIKIEEVDVDVACLTQTLYEALKGVWRPKRRHDLSLAVAGILLRKGVKRDVAKQVIENLVMIFDEGDEIEDRVRAVLDTYKKDPSQIATFYVLKERIGLSEEAAREVIKNVLIAIDKCAEKKKAEQKITTTRGVLRRRSDLIDEEDEISSYVAGLIARAIHEVVLEDREIPVEDICGSINYILFKYYNVVDCRLLKQYYKRVREQLESLGWEGIFCACEDSQVNEKIVKKFEEIADEFGKKLYDAIEIISLRPSHRFALETNFC
ncbi:hypothetical protein P8X24_07480 [Pyrococcus kukulkanii]|uniref:hypothetical protein n=1 Tax=Pyrococcus kukulkanii TaxID=1609559 RepID=UPI00356A4AB2